MSHGEGYTVYDEEEQSHRAGSPSPSHSPTSIIITTTTQSYTISHSPPHPASGHVAALVLHVHHTGLLVRSAVPRLVSFVRVMRVLAASLEFARPAVDIHLAAKAFGGNGNGIYTGEIGEQSA